MTMIKNETDFMLNKAEFDGADYNDTFPIMSHTRPDFTYGIFRDDAGWLESISMCEDGLEPVYKFSKDKGSALELSGGCLTGRIITLGYVLLIKLG